MSLPTKEGIQSKPWFVPVVASILAICLLWIVIFAVRSFRSPYRGIPSPPDTPEYRQAQSLAAQLHADERFRYLTVNPSPTNPTTMVIGGELDESEDVEILKETIDSMKLGFPVEYFVVPLRN